MGRGPGKEKVIPFPPTISIVWLTIIFLHCSPIIRRPPHQGAWSEGSQAPLVWVSCGFVVPVVIQIFT